MYKVELTAGQLDALFVAIQTHRNSFDDYTKEELAEYGINSTLSKLRQVEAKLENATTKAGA
jgi:hypothetical protein